MNGGVFWREIESEKRHHFVRSSSQKGLKMKTCIKKKKTNTKITLLSFFISN